MDALEVRVASSEQRLAANHNSISTLRDTSARHDTKIEVIGTELREVRDDIGEIRVQLGRDAAARQRDKEKDREEREKEREKREEEGEATRKLMRWVAATMGMFALSICSLVAVILASG